MKKALLLLLILLSSSNTLIQAFSAENWDTLKTVAYHGAFLVPVISNTYRYVNTENILKNNFTKIEDKNIINFITAVCNKITDQEISFYTGDATVFGLPKEYIAAAVGDKNIIIEPDYYKIIEEYIYDETKENRDTILNILSFIMQHETGHLKNNDMKTRIIRSIAVYAAKACLFEASKKVLDFKASQLITFLSLNIMDTLIQSYFNKQQEYRADSGITGKNTIAGGKQFFTNIINLAKNDPAIDLAIKLDLNHPTPEDRLKILQELDPAV